jgi:hypothetical protein
VARFEETANAYRKLVGKLLGTRSLERLRRVVKLTLKLDLRERVCELEDGRSWLRTMSSGGLQYYRSSNFRASYHSVSDKLRCTTKKMEVSEKIDTVAISFMQLFRVQL